MNQEFKKKWVEGLRGGKYTQIAGVLINHEGCCCALGVLVRECFPEEVKGHTHHIRLNHRVKRLSQITSLEVIYVTKLNEKYIGPTDEQVLVLNKPFSQIADWVEENL